MRHCSEPSNTAKRAEKLLEADTAALPATALGASVVEMVDDAMAAYADEDTEACFAIDTRDGEIDAMCEEAFGAVVRDFIESEIEEGTSGQDIEGPMGEVSRLRLTIRGLERIGDHAVNTR